MIRKRPFNIRAERKLLGCGVRYDSEVLTPLKRIIGLRHRVGGEPPSGWLPVGAATPLPTPIEEVIIDLEIATDGDAYFLIYRDSKDPKEYDSWFETLDDAMESAYHGYGVTAADWMDV